MVLNCRGVGVLSERATGEYVVAAEGEQVVNVMKRRGRKDKFSSIIIRHKINKPKKCLRCSITTKKFHGKL